MAKKATLESNANLDLWNRVSKTDPKFTKAIPNTGGLKLTAIGAQYQKKNATEQFGVYGESWGLKQVSYEFLRDLQPYGETLAFCKAIFFHPTGEFPISSAIKVVAYSTKYKNHRLDDDFAKKVETDIITKALSHLGFNADVHMGSFEDNKYVADITKEFNDKRAAASPPSPPKLKDRIAAGTFKNMMDAINSGDKGRIDKVKAYLEGVADIPEKKELLAEMNK